MNLTNHALILTGPAADLRAMTKAPERAPYLRIIAIPTDAAGPHPQVTNVITAWASDERSTLGFLFTPTLPSGTGPSLTVFDELLAAECYRVDVLPVGGAHEAANDIAATIARTPAFEVTRLVTPQEQDALDEISRVMDVAQVITTPLQETPWEQLPTSARLQQIQQQVVVPDRVTVHVQREHTGRSWAFVLTDSEDLRPKPQVRRKVDLHLPAGFTPEEAVRDLVNAAARLAARRARDGFRWKGEPVPR